MPTKLDWDETLIVHDLTQAALNMQECCRRLFYVYDRANKLFTGEAGQVDPATVHYGIAAAGTGLMAMCEWMREVGDHLTSDHAAQAKVLETWLNDRLSDRGLALVVPRRD